MAHSMTGTAQCAAPVAPMALAASEVSMTFSETDLLHLFIERVPFVLPNLRVFRRNVINVEAKGGYRVRNGIAGQADAYAIRKGGLHVEIETKAARGKLRTAQVAWRGWCHAWGVPHLILQARLGETSDATVQRWIAELGEVCANV